MIERKILIGLITNSDFLKQIEDEWDGEYIESQAARLISDWCWEYYAKFHKAPMREIETIYLKKLKTKRVNKELAEEIETEIFPSLSEEYDAEQNVDYLLETAREFFAEQQIQFHIDEISTFLEKGKLDEAKTAVEKFKLKEKQKDEAFNLASPEALQRVAAAFQEQQEPVVKFPGALGDFWNEYLVRGGLVGILAPEKRGKCLTGSQRILTSTGEYWTLDRIFKEKRTDIISFNEQTQKFQKTNISDFWVNGKKRVFQVTTKTGRTVEITRNHPFLTPDGWKDLTKIGVGDFIAVPKEVPIFGDTQMSKTAIKLLAYLIAEGCLREYSYTSNGKQGTSRVISFSNAEISIQKDFEACISSYGCSVKWDGIYGTVLNHEKHRNKQNKNRVFQMLIKYGMWNKLAIEKFIPEEIFKTTKENIALFLRILFTCDGWVNKGGDEIGYCSASKQLAEHVHFLLTKFGVVSRMYYSPNDKNGAWMVSIRDYENMNKFKNEIGFVFSKQEKLLSALKFKKPVYKSFLDKFPYQIAKKYHDAVFDEFGYKETVQKFKKAPSIREQIVKKQPIMRQSFTEVSSTKSSSGFWDSQLLWDEIIDVTYMGVKETYDITVEEHHNFIAENIVVHNTFLLLEFMMRAFTQKKRVAFFQAGDMTEAQQIIRTAIYLCKRSNKEKYCGTRYIPVQDCIHNQKDTCRRRVRECSFGLFGEEMGGREDITKQDLIEALESNPDYKPCYNCKEWLQESNHWGTPWLQKIEIKQPLTEQAALKAWERFFVKAGRDVMLSTHANGTLTVTGMEKILDDWKEKQGFEPDLVLVDYGDLLVSEVRTEFRHQEDAKWKRLRGLSQKTNALWVVPTQADAESYKKDVLDMTNYSEDKRKNAHVTALFGLNQDKHGREKEIGIMRINKIVVRDGDFNPNQQVHVLQHLAIGRPYLGSYY